MTVKAWKVCRFNYSSLSAKGKYKLTYTPGEITTAIPLSIGIALYTDIQRAEAFANSVGGRAVEVEVLAQVPNPETVSQFSTTEDLDEFYEIVEAGYWPTSSNSDVVCIYPDKDKIYAEKIRVIKDIAEVKKAG